MRHSPNSPKLQNFVAIEGARALRTNVARSLTPKIGRSRFLPRAFQLWTPLRPLLHPPRSPAAVLEVYFACWRPSCFLARESCRGLCAREDPASPKIRSPCCSQTRVGRGSSCDRAGLRCGRTSAFCARESVSPSCANSSTKLSATRASIKCLLSYFGGNGRRRGGRGLEGRKVDESIRRPPRIARNVAIVLRRCSPDRLWPLPSPLFPPLARPR